MMSNAKHTPGPWMIEPREYADGPVIQGPDGDAGNEIAQVFNIEGNGLENARLIAAAPEILEELKLIKEGWEARDDKKNRLLPLNPWEKERLGFVRATIAKATSEVLS